MGALFTLSNGKNIEYRRYGDQNGYAVLGFHGLIGTVDMEGFDEQIAGLPVQYILIARPGYGRSDYYPMENIMQWTKDLKELLDAFHIKECDIVGMSAGAPYAYALAVAEPNRVRSLYIYSGIGAIYKPDVLACYEQTENFFRELDLFQNGTPEDIATYLNQLYILPLPAEQKREQAIIDSTANEGLGMALCAKLEFQHWGFDIEKVEQPVRIYHSRDDEEVPYSMAEKTASYLKNVRVYSYAGEPHTSSVIMEDIMKTLIIKHCGLFRTIWVMFTRNLKRDRKK